MEKGILRPDADDIARAIGRAFGKTCPNLKSLRKALDGKMRSGHNGAAQLLHILCSHESHLTRMLSEANRRSIRDQIAHESFLPAGSLKIRAGRANMPGVPKSRPAFPARQAQYRLSEIVDRQLGQLEALIRESLKALQEYCLARI